MHRKAAGVDMLRAYICYYQSGDKTFIFVSTCAMICVFECLSFPFIPGRLRIKAHDEEDRTKIPKWVVCIGTPKHDGQHKKVSQFGFCNRTILDYIHVCFVAYLEAS